MTLIDFYLKAYSSIHSEGLISHLRGLILKVSLWHIPKLLSKQRRYSNNNSDVIVSFTSFPARINNVWQVVECMKRQSCKPFKILLWLSKEQFATEKSIPESLRNRVDHVFEIRMVEGDIKSHKKYYYVFKEFPHNKIILIDDDIYYPTDMISNLLAASLLYPNSVICRYGYIIKYNERHEIMPYGKWEAQYKCYIGYEFFFGSGGGTLVCPNILYKDVCNSDLFLKLTPTADDIWLNAMTKLAGLRTVKVSVGPIMSFSLGTHNTLCEINLGNNQNDVQIRNVSSYFKLVNGVDPFALSNNQIIKDENTYINRAFLPSAAPKSISCI